MKYSNNLLTDNNLMRRKAHTLISFVLAKYDLDSLENPAGESWCPISEMKEHEDELVHDHLISYAALMRVNDDLSGKFKEHEKNVPSGIGVLEYRGEKRALALREACNKIIHSKSYEWVLSYDHEHPLYPLYSEGLYKSVPGDVHKKPKLKLEGELHGNHWVAEINFLMFVLFYGYSSNA